MSPILDASYEDRDLDYVRFRPSPADDRIAMVVTRSTIAGADELFQMRTDMDEYDRDLIGIFAMRRVVAALRTRAINLALEALDAITLPGPPWQTKDSDFRLYLFVALTLGAGDEEIERRAERATPIVAAAVYRDLETMTRVSDISEVGAIEVQTSHGLGLIPLPSRAVQADSMWLAGVSIVHSGSPVVHTISDEMPSVNLATIAVDIADAVDATGALTGPIAISTLAAQWFSESPSASFIPTHGCLGFTVAPSEMPDHYVDVTVADLPPDIDSDELAQLATSNDLLDERCEATSHGSVLVLVTPAPFFGGDALDAVDGEWVEDEPGDVGESDEESEPDDARSALSTIHEIVAIAHGILAVTNDLV